MENVGDNQKVFQGEEHTTISTVIPSVMDLNLHQKLVLQRLSPIGTQRRFTKYTDPNDANFEQMFLLEASIDPRYQLFLNHVQRLKIIC